MRISDWSSDVCSSDLRYSYSSSQSATADGLEGPGLLSQCHFGGQTLHRGGAVESVAGFGVVQHVGGVVRHGDGAAMHQDEDVGQIGRAHVGTPVTNAHLVCSYMFEKTQTTKTHMTVRITP